MYFFLSVLAICAFSLGGFALWLYRRPAITPAQYDDFLARLEKAERILKSIAISKGLGGQT